MSKRLLNHDSLTGISTFHEYDALTNETRIIHSGDSTPYLEMNKKISNETDITAKGIKDGLWLYASIPPAVQVKWLIEKGVDVYNKHHTKEVLKLVNDPEYAYLKTTTKYHS